MKTEVFNSKDNLRHLIIGRLTKEMDSPLRGSCDIDIAGIGFSRDI